MVILFLEEVTYVSHNILNSISIYIFFYLGQEYIIKIEPTIWGKASPLLKIFCPKLMNLSSSQERRTHSKQSRARRIILTKLSPLIHLGKRRTFSHSANKTPDFNFFLPYITQVLHRKFKGHYQLLSDNKGKQNATTSSAGK